MAKWERIGNVSVGKHPSSRCYQIRYRAPDTGRRTFKSTGVARLDQARRIALRFDDDLTAQRLDPGAK